MVILLDFGLILLFLSIVVIDLLISGCLFHLNLLIGIGRLHGTRISGVHSSKRLISWPAHSITTESRCCAYALLLDEFLGKQSSKTNVSKARKEHNLYISQTYGVKKDEAFVEDLK